MRSEATDSGRHLSTFNGEMLLRCPKCGALARSSKIPPDAGDLFAPRRLVCSSCAYVKEWNARTILPPHGDDARDEYFQLPFFLQVHCATGVLWAYNAEHLQYLKSWLEAPLRSRRSDHSTGWANSSALSRLPKWLKLAKNRAAVSTALHKLTVLADSVPSRSARNDLGCHPPRGAAHVPEGHVFCPACDKVLSCSLCWEYCFADRGGPMDTATELKTWIRRSGKFSSLAGFHKICTQCPHCQWSPREKDTAK